MTGTLKIPNRRCAPRRYLFLLVVLSLLTGTAHAAQIDDSLSYRSALFYYFQQDYFNALTELMTAMDDAAPDSISDASAILYGGASLSYGMEQEASRIFETLLADPDATRDRDLAWFYLGKLAWQRGAPEASAAALDKMAPSYLSKLTSEANFLRASINLQQGKALLASTYESLIPAESPWLYYLYYNLGTHYATQHDVPTATAYFERAANSPLSTPELNALQDKALTASGYVLLAAESYEQAVEMFSRVRLDSPVVDRALLGLGWGYYGMGEFNAAVTPWQTLGEHASENDNVRESLLALPSAYEHLGRRHTALDLYKHADIIFSAQLKEVETAINALQEGTLSLQPEPTAPASRNWLSASTIYPAGEYPPYLYDLIPRRDFQLAMHELQDLKDTRQFLANAEIRLKVLTSQDQNSKHTQQIAELHDQVQQQVAQVRESILATTRHTNGLAAAELQRQAEKLRRALEQSRLAVVRLYVSENRQVLQ